MTEFGICRICKVDIICKVATGTFDCGFGLHLYKGLSPSPGLAWFAGLDQFARTLVFRKKTKTIHY